MCAEGVIGPVGLRGRLAVAGAASTVAIAWALLIAGAASARWVEPVPGPVNQTNALAFGINGDGSTPFVGLVSPAQSGPLPIQVSSPEAGSWNLSARLNGSGYPQGDASITPTRLPYVAWLELRTEPTRNVEVFVSKFEGTGWARVGGSLNHNETVDATQSGGPSIAYVGSVPWVAWLEGGTTIWVARLNGDSWAYVGQPISLSYSLRNLTHPSLTSVNGVPWLAYSNQSGVHVVTLTNGNWREVPGPFNAGGSQPSIASVAGVPYLAWSDGAHLRVSRFSSNSSWATSPSLNIDSNEGVQNYQISSVNSVPWIVWTESSHPYASTATLYHVYVKEFDGVTWDQDGGVLNIDPNQSAYAGGITDVAGSAYVAITQQQTDGGTAVRVLRWQGYQPFVSPVSSKPAPSSPSAREIKFQFVLRNPATVTMDFTQPLTGRRDRGVCVAASSRNRGLAKCTRHISRGRLSFHAHAGTNTLLFDGRLSNARKLKSGTYTVLVTATDAAGKRSASRAILVTI